MYSKEKKNNKPLLVGLTGGIGSGKSTIAKIFNALGVKVYNSDIEAKKVNSDIVKILRLIFKKDWQILSKLKVDSFSQNLFKEISDNYYCYILSSYSFKNNLTT